MRHLSSLETQCIAGSSSYFTTIGALFIISSAAIVLLQKCYANHHCGWQAIIVDNTFFQYQWRCK